MQTKYVERFLGRIIQGIGDGACWEWDGAHTTAGYAETWDGKRVLLAHRVAYEMWVGPIPPKLTIDHMCKNRGCINPAHLRVATQRKNILYGNGMSARHARKTHCKYGHPFDEQNTYINKHGGRECRACWSRQNRARLTHCPQGHPLDSANVKIDKLGRRRCQLCRKTHCPQGHPYDDKNTYVSKRGDRMCRACARERARKSSRRAKK